MDRSLFKTEMIIKLLESMDINFIMAAVRNERIKRMLNEFATFLLYMKMESKEEDRPVEKYIAFVTNIKFGDPERIVSVIPEEYRWGTSYRVEDGFEAKTTSRDFTLRVI